MIIESRAEGVNLLELVSSVFTTAEDVIVTSLLARWKTGCGTEGRDYTSKIETETEI